VIRLPVIGAGERVGAPHRLGRLRRQFVPPAVLLVAGSGGIALLGGAWVAHPVAPKLVLAVLLAALMLVVGLIDPRGLLFALVVWLAVLGLVRRLTGASDPTATFDPLLLILPLAMVVLVLLAARAGAFRSWTPLAKAVAVLSSLVAIGALNPLQGNIATGVAGLFFMGVPILGFWVGRGLCDDATMRRLFHLIGALSVFAALYGLAQTLRGFPTWDQAWIDRVLPGYHALGIGTSVRPFGTFSAAAEYGFFLTTGLVVWLFFGLKTRRAPLTVFVVGILGVALLYQNTRTALVLLVLALGLATAAHFKMPLAMGAIAGAVLLGLFFGLASRWGSPSTSRTSSAAAVLVAHEVQGLANPLDPKDSTLLVHVSLVGQGLHSALAHPLGVGDGAVTIASAKFGGLISATEVDLSNVAVALGVPGVLAYLAVLVIGLPKAYRSAVRRGDALSLVTLCVPVIMMSQWLTGGLYAVAFLPWLALGWLDRPEERQLVPSVPS